MAEESFDERTEAPTDKRRSEAREKGNVAKSSEINSTLVLLVGIVMLKICSPWMYREMAKFMQSMFELTAHPRCDFIFVQSLVFKSMVFLFYACLPVSAAIMVVGIVANIVQVGFLFTLQPLAPNLSKLDVISGAQRLVSLRSVVEIVKDLAKLGLIGSSRLFYDPRGVREIHRALEHHARGHLGVYAQCGLYHRASHRPGAFNHLDPRYFLSALRIRKKTENDKTGNKRRTQANGGRSAHQIADPLAATRNGASPHDAGSAQGNGRRHQPHVYRHCHHV